MVRAKTAPEAPRPLICLHRVPVRPGADESGSVPDTYHPAMSPTTLVRGRLRDHPLWSRTLAAPEIVGRLIQPVIVSARVEDRERVPDVPFLERLSLTELVRDAREASSAGLAGFLIFAASDRKDELALLASERDHIVARAIHAVKDAAPDLAVATDVCVCAYTPHGQCVLFAEGQANVAGTLDRLSEIAAVHADAGADLLIPSGMLEGSVRALRAAVSSAGRPELPIAAMVKLESVLYGTHRVAVEAMPVTERAVPLIAVDDRDGARTRAAREVAAGADAVRRVVGRDEERVLVSGEERDHRSIDALGDARHEIERDQARLQHDRVRARRDFAGRARARTVSVVDLDERHGALGHRHRLHRNAMRPIQNALELDHRRDRELGPSRGRHRGAKRAHAALEHPRWDEQVGAGVRVHRGDLAESIERAGDVRLAFREQDALTMRRIRADANVGRDREVRGGIFHGVDCAGDDVVALARKERVLILPI